MDYLEEGPRRRFTGPGLRVLRRDREGLLRAASRTRGAQSVGTARQTTQQNFQKLVKHLNVSDVADSTKLCVKNRSGIIILPGVYATGVLIDLKL